MKPLTRLFTVLCLFIAICSWAQIPQTVSYQGILTGPDGTVVADGSYSLEFNLYTTGTGGTSNWTERQEVTITNGLFYVILGSVNPLDLPFDEPYFLGITVEEGTELSPRIQMTAAAYSLTARTVADSSISGAGVQDGEIVRSVNSLKDDVFLIAGDHVSISQVEDSLFISSIGDGTGLWSQYESTIYYTAGNVGIGTPVASYPLTINPATSLRGVNIDHVQTGPGDTYGLYVDLERIYEGNYTPFGIFSQVNNYNGTQNTYGVYGHATGNSNGPKLGIYGTATGNGDKFGVYGTVGSTGDATHYGVLGFGGGSGTGTHYGLYGLASGSGTQYGVYGEATGSGTLWAGYFTGNVYAGGNLGIGTTFPQYPLTILPGTSVRGINIDHNQTEAGDTYGMYVDVTRTATGNNQAVGIYSQATNNDGISWSYGLFGSANGTAAGSKFGIYGLAGGSGSNYAVYGVNGSNGDETQYGVRGSCSGSGDGVHHGVYGNSTGTGMLYGVYGYTNGTGTAAQYGVRGEAAGSGSGVHYGVYGTASGEGTLWSGYFTGNVYTGGNLGIGITSPSERLEVAGTIHSTTGGFMFPDGSVQTTAAVFGQQDNVITKDYKDEITKLADLVKSLQSEISVLKDKIYHLEQTR